MDKNFLLGVGITNGSEEEILEYIIKGLEKSSASYYIVTPNPEILVYANNHPRFKSILNNARLACPDGIGIIWAGKILGKNFKEKVTGVDLMKKLCERVPKKPITVGFLGGGPKIAEVTAECLVRENPGLEVVFAQQEWPTSWLRSPTSRRNNFGRYPHVADDARSDVSKEKNLFRSLSKRLFSSSNNNTNSNVTAFDSSVSGAPPSIDILFVAFGFPKQEEWMAENVGKIPVGVMMGVGGAFDYISGKVPRAPKFLRSLGLEWLFRLMIQPWRVGRQLSLITFVKLVLKEHL